MSWALATFLCVLSLNLFAWLVKARQLARVTVKKKLVEDKVVRGRLAAESYNSPSTYGKYAKLQREIAACEREMAALKLESTLSIEYKVKVLVRYCKATFTVLVTCFLWRKPTAWIDSGKFWPVAWLLAFPFFSQGQGAVSVLVWLTWCELASQSFLQALLPIHIFRPYTTHLKTE